MRHLGAPCNRTGFVHATNPTRGRLIPEGAATGARRFEAFGVAPLGSIVCPDLPDDGAKTEHHHQHDDDRERENHPLERESLLSP